MRNPLSTLVNIYTTFQWINRSESTHGYIYKIITVPNSFRKKSIFMKYID